MAFSNNGLPDVIIHGGFPLPLRWSGWSTTTHHLKALGWEILAHEEMDLHQDGLRLTLSATSPNKDVMLSGFLVVPFYALSGARFSGQNIGMPTLNHLAMAGIEMKHYHAKDTYRTVSEFDVKAWNSMKPIDIYGTTKAGGRFADLKCFKYTEDGPAIYIPPSSENELLDMLLRVQYPNQQEIKKKLVLPDTKPIIKAQVFSLVA